MDVPTSAVLYMACGFPTNDFGMAGLLNSTQGGTFGAAVRASTTANFTTYGTLGTSVMYDMNTMANTAPSPGAVTPWSKLYSPEGSVFCVAADHGVRSGYGGSQVGRLWPAPAAGNVCTLPYSLYLALGMDHPEACVDFACGSPYYHLFQIYSFETGCVGGNETIPPMPGRPTEPTWLGFSTSAGNNISPEYCGGMPTHTYRYRTSATAPWSTPAPYVAPPADLTGFVTANPLPFAAITPSLQGEPKGVTTVADPVNTATGAFTHSESDLHAPGAVQGLDVGRWYNSSDVRSSVHGVGWAATWSDSLLSDGSGGYTYAEPTGRLTTFTSAGSGSWAHPVGVEATLVLRADTSPALLFSNGEVAEFDVAGRVEQRVFPDGQTVSAVRNTAGFVLSVTSSVGPSLTFTYASPPTGTRLMSVAGSWGDTVSYGYDTAGRLVSVTRPGSIASTYTNDPTTGLLTSLRDPSNVRQVLNVYNSDRQVVSQTAASGAITLFTYNRATRSTTVHDPVTNTDLTYLHDPSGRVVSITDPYGKVVSRTWDGQSNALSAVNRNGTLQTNTFDASNNLLTASDPKAGVTTYTYDSQNRVASVKTPANDTTLYTYTGTNRSPATITDPQSHVWSHAIANGLVMSITDPDGVVTSFTYSGRQVATTTDGVGNVTGYTYDSQGRRTKVTLPSGKFSTTVYDTANRVSSQTDFDGGVTVYTYDAAGRVLTVKDPTLVVTSSTFDYAGRFATSTAANGAVSTYTYDGDDQLISTQLPGGATTSRTLGPLGRVLTETDEIGRVTTYTYDVAGNQKTVTATDGGVTMNTFDTNGRLASVTDPVGHMSKTTFDAAGRVATQIAPGSLTTSYTYDAVGRPLTVTDPRGGVTTTTYTPGGRTASVKNAAGLVTSFTYDLAGRLKTQVEPPNRTSTITYDVNANRATVTDPAGLVTSFTYDTGNRMATVTDPAGVVTTNTWSLRSELLTTKVGAQGTVIYTYNPDRTVKDVKDANGNLTTFGYDNRGRRTTRTGPLGGIDTWTYDNAGQTLTATDAANRQMVYTYDPVGRPATATDPTGRKTTTGYNADGSVKTIAVLNGTTYTYGYDPSGRVSAVSDTSGATWFYGYEPGGQINSYVTPTGRETTFGYDNAGRRTKLAYPDGSTYLYNYDTAGRVATITPGEVLADTFTGTTNAAPDTAKWSVTNASGGTARIVGNELELGYTTTVGSASAASAAGLVQSDFDVRLRYRTPNNTTANAGLLRVVARQVTGATPTNYRVEINSSTTTAIIYRTAGTVTTSIGTFAVPVTTSAQQLRFQVKGSLVSARVWANGTSEPNVWNIQVIDTQVIAAGTARVEVRQNATGAGAFYVDNLVITNPTIAPAAVATYTYNADSQITGEALIGGTRARTFTNGRLTAFNETLPGLNRATTIGYDPTGRIASEATGGVTTTYGYDPAGQLLSATPTTGNATVYTYDPLGRRATTKIGTAAATTNTYDPTGGLLTDGTSVYTYDTAGRRLQETATGNTLNYTYDPAGQLATLQRTAGTLTTKQTRTYDALGILSAVSTLTGTITTATTLDWDPTDGIAQLIGLTTSSGVTDVLQGLSGPTSARSGLGTTAYGLDQHGSVISGPQARSTNYGAFGEPTTGTASFEPKLGYRGELTVDKLTYLRARDYQPATGTFTTPDPIEGQIGATTLSNRYHYTNSQPLQRIDPSGMFAVFDGEIDVGVLTVSQIALSQAEVEAEFWKLVGPLARAPKLGGPVAAVTIPVAISVAFYNGTHKSIEATFEDKGWSFSTAFGAYKEAFKDPFGLGRHFENRGLNSPSPPTNQSTPSTTAPTPQTAGAGVGKGTGKPPLCATNTRLDASTLKMTKTVEAHLEEYSKSGRPTRPYGGSILTLQEIIDAAEPVADPQGVPGACRWDVPGSRNGKSGMWELVISMNTGTILHFFFNPS